MKTKTLLIAAATLAVGVIASQAAVYSANIVGYINVPLTNGYNAFANQLDLDGTGTNNTIQTVIGTNLPVNTKVYTYDPSISGYRYVTLFASGWSSGAAGPYVKTALQPGGGTFIFIPGSNVSTNVTLVGNVLPPATNNTVYLSQYQMASYRWPVSGYLTTNLNYAPNAPVGTSYDLVLQWNPVTQLFVTHKKFATTWQAGSPNIGVAESFFLIPNQTTTWTNYFPTPQ